MNNNGVDLKNQYLNGHMVKKEEAKLIFIGIVISAYMTISYDMTSKLLIDPYTNTMPIAQHLMR